MRNRPIALVGLRCTGKTSVGERLAARLGRPFHDLDREIVHAWVVGAGRASPPDRPGSVLVVGER
jgi:hypothetical protein